MLSLKKKKKTKDSITFFNEQWKEVELIGEGSYGKVYKAKKEEFGIATYSAIKQIEIPQTKSEIQTLKTEGMSQNDITSYYENTVQKWVEEIKFMSIFKDCENIVNIEDYEIIKKKNDIGWIINIRMELLKNLDAYILENNVTDKEILKMAIDVTSALEECEQNDVIHRDIKPDNIFVNSKGVYKVGDFGIAKHIENTVSNMSKKGTENYMAPEVYKNEKGNKTVDIYSLGIMLYRYFNYNRLPFLPDYPEKITVDAREEALYKRISGKKLKSPKNASREIAEIILKACSYYPKERYTSAADLKIDLQKIYENIKKPTILFNFNEKQMNKIFLENTKSDHHDETLSVFVDKQPKDALDMTVGIGLDFPKEEQKALNAENNEVLANLETVKENLENTKNEEKKSIIEQSKNDKQGKIKNRKEKKQKRITQNIDNQEKNKQKKDKEESTKEEKIKSPLWIKLKNNRIKIIVAIGIILVIVGSVEISKLNKQEVVSEIEYVKMIQVVGLTSEEATQKINDLGLEVQYEYEEVDDETQVGKVLEQSIQENQEIVKGSTVTIKVAVSKQKVVMINVVGMNIEEAIQQLAGIGLQANVTEQYSNDVPQGIVISQMTSEGEEVNLGITIELLVSKGQEIKDESEKNNDQNDKNETQNKTWSSWVENLPSGVNAKGYDIEQKTQYSYRTKQTTTSSNSNLDGWTQYDVQKTYGKTYITTAYDQTYSNTDTEEYTLLSESSTFNYTHTDGLYNGAWYVAGSYSSLPQGASAGQQITTSIHKKSSTIASANTVSGETLYAIGQKCSHCGIDAWVYTGSSTAYQYKVTEVTKTYYYYKWSDWTGYSDTVATSNDSTEVRTRTLYRYKLK